MGRLKNAKGGAEHSEMAGVHGVRIGLLATAAVVAGGAFMPWSTIESTSWTFRGTSTGHSAMMGRLAEVAPFGDGWLVITAAAAISVGAIASFRAPRLLLLSAIGAVLAIAIAIFEWSELVSEAGTTYYTTGGAVRWGLPVVLMSATVCLVLAAVGFRRSVAVPGR